MPNLIQLFFLALIGSLIALIGGVVFLFNKKWSSALEKNSIPFAAGVLITVSLLGLLPEAFEIIGERTLLIMLISFFVAYLFEHLIFDIHHHAGDGHSHHKKNYKTSVPLVIFGDTIHNFIDGITIGSTFFISPGLGLITAISTFLHEVPHEIGDFGILLKAGWKRKDILIVNVISASATIFGAFALLLFSGNEVLIGILLSISAGIFLYLGAIDFLPHAGEGFPNKIKAMIPLTIGILAIIIALMAVPHAH